MCAHKCWLICEYSRRPSGAVYRAASGRVEGCPKRRRRLIFLEPSLPTREMNRSESSSTDDAFCHERVDPTTVSEHTWCRVSPAVCCTCEQTDIHVWKGLLVPRGDLKQFSCSASPTGLCNTDFLHRCSTTVNTLNNPITRRVMV